MTDYHPPGMTKDYWRLTIACILCNPLLNASTHKKYVVNGSNDCSW